MRRKWVWGLIGLGLVAVGLLAVVGDRILLRAMQRQVEANLSDAVFSQYADGLHVVLCGAGSPMPDPKRAGPCVAVVAGGQIFVVDVGSGAVRNMLHLHKGKAMAAITAEPNLKIAIVVDDEIDRDLRIDDTGIAAEIGRGVAHGGKVDDRRHAGEILHQDAGGAVGDLAVGSALLHPFGDRLDVVGGDAAPVFEAQQIFQQHLEGKRQAAYAVKAVLFCLRQRKIGVGLAADIHRLAGIEGID